MLRHHPLTRLTGPPEEELYAVVGHGILYGPHGLHQLRPHCRLAGQREAIDEVLGDSDQRLFGPRLEPVHCAAGDQAGEAERARTELLSHLWTRGDIVRHWVDRREMEVTAIWIQKCC